MKGSTVNRGAKIRNYAIALVLLIIGILPFIYLLIESFAGYDGHYLFDGRFVNGIEGIFYVAWFYLAFFFPIFAIAFLIIVISIVLLLYTKFKYRGHNIDCNNCQKINLLE